MSNIRFWRERDSKDLFRFYAQRGDIRVVAKWTESQATKINGGWQKQLEHRLDLIAADLAF